MSEVCGSLWEYRVVYPSGVTVVGFDKPLNAALFASPSARTTVERRSCWEPVNVTVGCERHLDEPHNLCEACWAVEPSV